jgi:hypothetical protein
MIGLSFPHSLNKPAGKRSRANSAVRKTSQRRSAAMATRTLAASSLGRGKCNEAVKNATSLGAAIGPINLRT